MQQHHKNLHITADGSKPVFRLFHHNTDGAEREKAFAQSCPDARWPRLKKLMGQHINSDFFCLVEVTGDKQRRRIASWLSKRGFQVLFGLRNASPLCTSNVVAFDASKFELESAENVHLLSDDPTIPDDNSHPNGWGANLFLVHLHRTAGGMAVLPAERITVGCTHFPIHKDSRDKCTASLSRWLQANEKKAYVISGDLNTFHDKGGPEQLAELSRTATVLGAESTSHSTGAKVRGTFVGFEHDAFKFPLGPELDPLDHVMVNPRFVTPVGDIECDTRTMLKPEPAEWASRDLPSDHLPLILKFTF